MIQGEPYEVFNQVPLTCYKGPKGAKLFLVHNMYEFAAFYEELMKQKVVACDTETNGFHYVKGNRIVGMSFGWGLNHFYLPVRHEDSVTGGKQPDQLSMDLIRGKLRAFFAQENVSTIWHNFKFDAHFYRVDGIEIRTPFHDTLNGWRLYDENAPAALKTIASGWKDVFGRWQKGLIGPAANAKEKEIDKWRGEEAKARRREFTKIVEEKAREVENTLEYQGMKRAQIKKHLRTVVLKDHPYADAKKGDVHYGYIPIAPLMVEYASTDTFLTLLVYLKVLDFLKENPGIIELYHTETKLTRVLMEVEHVGVPIDKPHLLKLSADFATEIDQLEQEIRAEFGKPFMNVNSNQQLIEELQSVGVTLTEVSEKTGQFKLDKEVLSNLSTAYPIVDKILRNRELKKLKSTYVDGILEKLTEQAYLHCVFNQMVKTGRMSCSDPNLQNIPGGKKADLIRRAFINLSDDYVYIFADYSQIELRLTAHYSQDPIMLDAFARGQDLHLRAMCEMFGYNYEECDKAKEDKNHPLYMEIKVLRTIAKRINFGIIYGVGAKGLATQTGKTESECQEFIDLYLRTYIGVKRMMNQGKREVRAHHQVSNRFGRVRHLPHIDSANVIPKLYNNASEEDIRRAVWGYRGRAERQAVNFKIQGEAADLFKTAVVRCYDYVTENTTRGSRLVNFVHDEIQFFIHKEELFLLNGIKQRMEDFDYLVPIVADFEWSKLDWSDKQALHV